MSAVQKVACPACGAPLPLEAAHRSTTCPFCGATAAPAPREIERVVERIIVAHDPHAESDGLRCPRCGRVLEDVRSAAKVVGVCTKCGGVWVDRATADYLTRVSDPDLETAVRRAVGVVISVPPNVRQASVSCPVCEQQARRVEIAGTVHGVDVCDEHGTWFDRDELAMFVKSFVDERAGDLSGDDLRAAGLPGPGSGADDGGFFSRVFRSLFASS